MHDDVIKWRHFPRNWPFVRGIYRSRWIPTQRPVTQSFDVFFDLRLNKQLSKQPWGWWFETPSWSLWRHCNDAHTTSRYWVVFFCLWLLLLCWMENRVITKLGSINQTASMWWVFSLSKITEVILQTINRQFIQQTHTVLIIKVLIF